MTDLPFQQTKSYEEFVEDILLQIVKDPEELVVEEVSDAKFAISINIKTSDRDRGRVIGREGAVIGSIHKLLVAMSFGGKIDLNVKNGETK